MDKRCIIVIVLCAAVLVQSCSSNNKGKIKIGFILKTMQEERYKTDKLEFEKRAAVKGVEVIFASSDNDHDLQRKQFADMVDQGCRQIVFQPVNTARAGEIVKYGREKGVKVIGYDTMLVNGPLDIMVMQDSWAVGKLQGEALLKWLVKKKGKVEGNVVLVKGQPGDSNANAMSSGVHDTIAKNPGLVLLAEKSHEDWSPVLAKKTAKELLNKYNGKIDAFLCNNSGLCSGVIAALSEAGISSAEKIFTAGSDADLLNIRYIVKGKQNVEIWKKIKPLAVSAVDIAVLIAKNPEKPVNELIKTDKMINNGYMIVPTIVTEVALIDKDNIDSTLIAEKIYTREQVYGN